MADLPNPGTAGDLVRTVVSSLASIDGLQQIWRRGLVHAGGPHYRLSRTTGPISIGEDECLILGKLIARFRPSTCFMIGNGFGLSSAFVAKMMEGLGGSSVVTLDNLTEGDGRRCFDTAEKLRRRLECRILRNERGTSPRDIRRVVDKDSYEFVFIDGNHAHPHVIEDSRGIQPLLHNSSIIGWHDYWLPGVAASVSDAQASGFRCLKVNSSCEMVFGTRDEHVFDTIAALFEAGEPPTPRRHPLARLTLSCSFVWETIGTLMPSRHGLGEP